MPMTARRPRTATRPRVRLSEYTVDPASATTVQCRDQTITIPGLAVGDVVIAIGPQGLTADVQPYVVRVATLDVMELRLGNPTAGGVDAASGTWLIVVLSGLPMSEYTIDPAEVATITAPSQNITIPGLAVGDVILAIGPAALINDVAFQALRVAAEDTLPLRAVNPSAGNVDAASQTWVLVNLKSLPMSEYTIDPADVATKECPSQNVTIPGLAVGDVILAIGPQGLTADVAFVPLRVAAEDTLPLRAFNSTGSGVNAASGTWTLINLGRAA